MRSAAALALLGLAALQAPSDEARALWAAGQRRDAIERAAELLEEHPADAELRSRLVGWEMTVHRYEAALDHMAPGDPRRGPALASLGRCEEALEHLSPSAPEHAETRVECLHRLGRFEEATAAARAAEALLGEGDARVHFWRGRAAAEAGDPRAAIPAFRAALERDPVHMGALFGLGRALVRAGEVEEGREVLVRHRELVPLVDARDFALQGLDLDPTHAPNLAHLAEIEARLGLVATARARFAEAERRAEPGEHVPVALRHARFLEDLGEADAAVEVLRRAVRVGDDVRLRVRAGDVLARAGRVPAAREEYGAALALRPEDPAIRARLAGLGEEP